MAPNDQNNTYFGPKMAKMANSGLKCPKIAQKWPKMTESATKWLPEWLEEVQYIFCKDTYVAKKPCKFSEHVSNMHKIWEMCVFLSKNEICATGAKTLPPAIGHSIMQAVVPWLQTYGVMEFRFLCFNVQGTFRCNGQLNGRLHEEAIAPIATTSQLRW